MTLFLMSTYHFAYSFKQKSGFSRTFLFLNKFSSNLALIFKLRFYFLFLAQKLVLGTILDNLTQNLVLCRFKSMFGQTPLRNSVTMATAKVTNDHKLLPTLCFMLIWEVSKFQLPTLNGFWAVSQKPPRDTSKIGLSHRATGENWYSTKSHGSQPPIRLLKCICIEIFDNFFIG